MSKWDTNKITSLTAPVKGVLARIGSNPAILVLLLLITPSLLYLPALGCDFIKTWDDQIYVLNNPYIQEFTLQNIQQIFTSLYVGNYFPLQVFSYMFDYAFWQYDPLGYHLTNILLHACNVALVFSLLLRLGCSRLLALAVAGIFAVHPVNVEVVVWVSQRKTLMASLFFLLSFIAYLRFARTRSHYAYAGSLVMFLLSLLSKTSTLVLPAILCAWLYREGRIKEWPSLVPFLLLSIAGMVSGIAFSAAELAIDTGTMEAEMLLGVIYPTMLAAYPEYLRLLFWPIDLSGFYDTAIFRSFTELNVLFGILVSIVSPLTLFVLANRNVRFWVLWAVLCILPMANIIPIQVYYADRYLYLSQIAVFVLVGMALNKIGSKLPGGPVGHRAGRLAAVAGLALLLGLATLTWERIGKWQNDIVFWEDVLYKYPSLYSPRMNLGQAYEREQMYLQAGQQYLTAYRVSGDPVSLGAYKRVQSLEAMRGRNSLPRQ